MSITEIIPALRALPRSEKVRIAQMLLDDLAGEELLSTLKQGQEFPLYTPEFAPGAAAQLARLLDEQGKTTTSGRQGLASGARVAWHLGSVFA